MRMKVGTTGLFLIALLAAAVTIGSDLLYGPNANGTCGSASCTVVQTVSAAPTPLKSPVNGAVVSWFSDQGGAGEGTYGNLRLRIIRDAGGGTYKAVRSGPATSIPYPLGHPIAITVNPGLPISQNDYVGVDLLDSTSALATRTTAGFSYAFWSPALTEGATLAPNAPVVAREALLQATIEPTNTFSIGAVTRNKKKGTATVSLALPNLGVLTGSGNGASVASAAGAVISKSAAAGPATLRSRPRERRRSGS